MGRCAMNGAAMQEALTSAVCIARPRPRLAELRRLDRAEDPRAHLEPVLDRLQPGCRTATSSWPKRNWLEPGRDDQAVIQHLRVRRRAFVAGNAATDGCTPPVADVYCQPMSPDRRGGALNLYADLPPSTGISTSRFAGLWHETGATARRSRQVRALTLMRTSGSRVARRANVGCPASGDDRHVSVGSRGERGNDG